MNGDDDDDDHFTCAIFFPSGDEVKMTETDREQDRESARERKSEKGIIWFSMIALLVLLLTH